MMPANDLGRRLAIQAVGRAQGEDMGEEVDWESARRINQEPRRVNVDSPPGWLPPLTAQLL
jgi:hypothetical protein